MDDSNLINHVIGRATVKTYKAKLLVFVLAVSAAVLTANTTNARGQEPAQPKPAGPTLRIVKDTLIQVDDPVFGCAGCLYAVKGSIYNPNNQGVDNVVIKYYIWKKWMGKDGHGLLIKQTGGLVSATIKYLPPKQTVNFTAKSGNAPVMAHGSGLVPDPISAEITAEWDTGNK